MAIQEHYNEALGVLHRMFRHIFDGLESRFAKELEVIRSQYPSEPVKFTEQPLIIHWGDAMKMLRDAGHEVDELADLSSALELTLGDLVKAKYGADFYILDQYPSGIRPFYTMPSASNPLYSNSYDLFIRGQEICSGAQRCHEPVSTM
jgi:aspartyl-tRNA synthetase